MKIKLKTITKLYLWEMLEFKSMNAIQDIRMDTEVKQDGYSRQPFSGTWEIKRYKESIAVLS